MRAGVRKIAEERVYQQVDDYETKGKARTVTNRAGNEEC